MAKRFDVKTFNVKKYNTLLKRGLSCGVGQRDEAMCIEAVICETMGLHKGLDETSDRLQDHPPCVLDAVADLKIELNDEGAWGSAQARARGLRDLGLAQLGSKGVIKEKAFLQALTKACLDHNLFRDTAYEDWFGHYYETLDPIPNKNWDLKKHWLKYDDYDSALKMGFKDDVKGAKQFVKVIIEVLRKLKSPGIKLMDREIRRRRRLHR